jgi:hypothetical protein
MKELSINLIAALIYTALGFAVSRIWIYYRQRFKKEYNKITYFRVIRLRFRDRDDAPYYIRHHHTLKGERDAVYDETWVLNGIQCTRREKLLPVHITSSGIVDAIQIMPVLDQNADNHPHTRNDAGKFTFSHPEPSVQLAAVGTLINGLQTSDNWWYGTTAQYDGQTLLLILDFTSLPYETCPVKSVTSVLERNCKIIAKETVAQQWFEEHYGQDIHYLRFRNAKIGDVIKFTFTIDVEAIPRIKNEGVPQPSIAMDSLHSESVRR